MTMRNTINDDGSMTTTSHGFMTSEAYHQDGIEVQRGMGSVTVASADMLQDTDLITVNGVQMPVITAREMGFVGNAAQPTTAPQPTNSQPAEPERITTGHEGYDNVAADLQARVEAGDLEGEEAFNYDLAVATVANADLTVTEVVDILDGINSGDLNPMDLDANTRQVAQSVEQRVTEAATKSAMSELGSQGFDRLAQLAAASSTVDQALRQYASMRALGRTTDSWNDFLAMAEEELGY